MGKEQWVEKNGSVGEGTVGGGQGTVVWGKEQWEGKKQWGAKYSSLGEGTFVWGKKSGGQGTIIWGKEH